MDVLHSLNGLEMMSRSKMVHYRAEQEEEYVYYDCSQYVKTLERVISQTIMKTLYVAIDNFVSNSILPIHINFTSYHKCLSYKTHLLVCN